MSIYGGITLINFLVITTVYISFRGSTDSRIKKKIFQVIGTKNITFDLEWKTQRFFFLHKLV
jgi:hypothetical protein